MYIKSVKNVHVLYCWHKIENHAAINKIMIILVITVNRQLNDKDGVNIETNLWFKLNHILLLEMIANGTLS